jgi:DNA-binding MarR family transcriptional regulator
LVELIGIDATNLVAILNSLEDAGFIERRRDRADRRRAIIELSASGGRVLADLDRSLRQLDDAVLADLTIDERDRLNALLYRTIDRNRADCTQPSAGEC